MQSCVFLKKLYSHRFVLRVKQGTVLTFFMNMLCDSGFSERSMYNSFCGWNSWKWALLGCEYVNLVGEQRNERVKFSERLL
jgi:hypothetical protein